jgi:hypothetical protein
MVEYGTKSPIAPIVPSFVRARPNGPTGVPVMPRTVAATGRLAGPMVFTGPAR